MKRSTITLAAAACLCGGACLCVLGPTACGGDDSPTQPPPKAEPAPQQNGQQQMPAPSGPARTDPARRPGDTICATNCGS